MIERILRHRSRWLGRRPKISCDRRWRSFRGSRVRFRRHWGTYLSSPRMIRRRLNWFPRWSIWWYLIWCSRSTTSRMKILFPCCPILACWLILRCRPTWCRSSSRWWYWCRGCSRCSPVWVKIWSRWWMVWAWSSWWWWINSNNIELHNIYKFIMIRIVLLMITLLQAKLIQRDMFLS